MLDEHQIESARQKLQQLERPLTLHFNPGADVEDPFSLALEQVVQKLVDLAGLKLELVQHEALDIGPEPFLKIYNIKYMAVPAGYELDPFLNLLAELSAKGQGQAELSGTIDLLIAPTCPSCPDVVSTCNRVALAAPQLQLRIIDAQYFKEMTGSVRSVPTVIIDHMRTVVGPLHEQQLLEILNERGQPSYFKKSLASMIAAGRMDEAIPLIVSETGLSALAELMVDGAMQERMGLMLLAEEALDQDQHCLNGALPHLLPLVEADDPTLRGDVADLLGKIGAPGSTAALKRLLQDENEDVREVAEESLSLLRQPS